MQRNLGDLIDLSGDPDALALIDVGDGSAPARRFRAAQLDQTACAVARALRREGFGRGEAIAILAGNGFEYLCAYLGTLRAGLVAVPVHTRLPAETVDLVCRDAGVRAVFADASARASCPRGLPVLDLEPRALARWLDPGRFESVVPREGETALLVYTSGSTGAPKGVELSHTAQWAGLDAIDPVARQGFRGQRALVAAPLFHINGMGFCSTMLHLGGTIVLLPRFGAGAFLEAIDAFRVDVVTGLPGMVARIAREEQRIARCDLSSVKLVYLGSAPLTEAVLEVSQRLFPGALVLNGYGTTETGGSIFGAHPEGLPRPAFSVGHPAPHVELRLVGGPGPDEGVLEIRSPTNMTGYRNRPEATAACLRDGWYHTGDVMRRDAQGFYSFVGREDDMFVCGGENVYPSELERLLEAHADLRQVCVVAQPDPVRGQVPAAFAVPRAGASPSEPDVQRFVQARAPSHLVPRRVIFLDELPLAGPGKVDRRALARRLGDATDRSARPD